jgi:multidrug efflux system outer membrane protein
MVHGRTLWNFALVMAFLTAVSGCKVGPDHRAWHDPLRAEWRQELDESLRTDQVVDPMWWAGFEDPALNSLVDRSLSQNLSLQEAVARIQESRARWGVSRSALGPNIDQTNSYTRIDISDNGNPFGATGRSFPAFDLWSTGFDVSWELDVFGRVRRSMEAAHADIHASVEDRNAIQVTLLGDVATSYVTVRAIEQRLANAAENVRIQSETVQVTLDRYEAGDVSELDVSLARTLLFRTQAAIPQLARERDLAINRLCVLQGEQPRDLTDIITPDGSIPKPRNQIDIGIPVNLVRQRPDIRRAEWEVVAQSARIGVATADLYPRFSLTGLFTLDSVELNSVFDSGSLAMRVGPQIRWNIFSFGRVRSNIAMQNAKFDQSIARYRKAVLGGVEEVENALASYRRYRDAEEKLAKAVESAKQAAATAAQQYREGDVGFQTLLDAERSLALSQDEHIATQGNVTLSVVQLYKALGGGWDWRAEQTRLSSSAIPLLEVDMTGADSALPTAEIPAKNHQTPAVDE